MLGLFLFFVAFGASVLAAQVTVSTPTAGQEFTVGDSIEIRFTTDANMTFLAISAAGPSVAFIIAERPFRDTYAYRTTWNTIGVPSGAYRLNVAVHYRGADGGLEQVSREVYPIVLNEPEFPPPDANAPVRVIRTAADTMRPRGWITVFLSVLPREDFTGIVLTEKIPVGFAVTGPWNQDYRFDLDTRELKIALKRTPRLEFTQTYYGLVDLSGLPIGTVLPLEGSWELLEQSGSTIGIDHITVEGVAIPNCPIPDALLLEYIDKWSKKELDADEARNDMYVLEVIRRWKQC